MSITNNLKEIKKNIPAGVRLIAVSKTHSPEIILEAYNCGQREFAENKVQELGDKVDKLPKDIKWHFIGHLQSNKVKYIAPYVYLIHGVDSLKLLKVIDKEGKKNDRIISVLLQLHIAKEDSKFGLTEDNFFKVIEEYNTGIYQNTKVKGVMGMATFTDDESIVKEEFSNLKRLYDKGKMLIKDVDAFSEISMGMTDDYQIAIEHGSTMVRIGSAIFGNR